MVRGADALRPTHRGFALRTAHLLLLPVHRELLERIGACDLHLPALTRTRRTPQGHVLLVAAVDEEVGANRGGIDEVLARRHVLSDEGLLESGRALRLMDAGRGRVDVREEVRGGGLARFADMHHGAGPGRVTFVAVAHVGIVGRCDAFSGRWQFPVRLEPHAALGPALSCQRPLLRPLVVTLPRPAQGINARECAESLWRFGRIQDIE